MRKQRRIGYIKAERCIQRSVTYKQTHQKERSVDQRDHHTESFYNMMFFIMSQLMTEHGFKFISRKLIYKCIIQHDTFAFSDTGKIRIRVTAAFRGIHDKHAACLESRLYHKCINTCLEFTVCDRRKFIKQRRNKTRIYKRDSQRKKDSDS